MRQRRQTLGATTIGMTEKGLVLLVGDSVALRDRASGLLVVAVDSPDGGSGKVGTQAGALQVWSHGARWLVVDGGGGQIALHNTSLNCFLRIEADEVSTAPALLPRNNGGAAQRFTVLHSSEGEGMVALLSAHCQHFLLVSDQGRVYAAPCSCAKLQQDVFALRVEPHPPLLQKDAQLEKRR